MGKKNIFKVLCVLLFALATININPSNYVVKAKDDLSLTIKAQDKINGDIQYNIWFSKEFDKFSDLDNLNSKKDAEITAIYGEPKIETQKQNQDLILNGLEEGNYYIREVNFDIERTQIAPVQINLKATKESDNTISPKVVLPGGFGNLIIDKVDNNKTPLSGVEFELYYFSPNGRVKVVVDKDGNFLKNETLYEIYTRYNGKLITDVNGKIKLYKLPVGDYELVETKPLLGYKIEKNNINIKIKKDENISYIIVNNKSTLFEKNFRKVSSKDNNIGLEGAIFKLVKIVNGEEITVKRDGKDFTVVSEKDGYFKITNLEEGLYKLYEVTAPNGYKLLQNGIEFKVDRNDSKATQIIIENNPKSKVPIIPRTGDVLIYVLFILGAGFILLGFKLIREGKNEGKEE